MFAICVIARDEPVHYVEEWLEWNRGIGVDRFFVYDNGGWSVTGKDIVVRPFPGVGMQIGAYGHALRNCDGADYLAMVDVDEFMTGPIIERLAGVENALSLNWKIFGTSGLESNVSGKQVGTFVDSVPAGKRISSHVKCIVRPARVERMFHPHYCEFVGGGKAEAFDGTRFDGPFNSISEFKGAWINHYFTRSMDDWRWKVDKGRVDVPFKRRMEGVFVVDRCAVESEEKGREGLERPYVASARYGVFPDMVVDVTRKVEEIVDGGSIEIRDGEYNKMFGDPAPQEIKRLRIEFGKSGCVVGAIDVGEEEGLFVP